MSAQKRPQCHSPTMPNKVSRQETSTLSSDGGVICNNHYGITNETLSDISVSSSIDLNDPAFMELDFECSYLETFLRSDDSTKRPRSNAFAFVSFEEAMDCFRDDEPLECDDNASFLSALCAWPTDTPPTKNMTIDP